jgi:hypothetical protein
MTDHATSEPTATGQSSVEGPQGERQARRIMRIYAAVVAVELFVLLALWMFSRHFGS